MRTLQTIAVLAVLAVAGAGSAAAQAGGAATPPKVPHPVAGRADCLSCHGAGVKPHVVSVPADHHYASAACAMCHHPADTMPTPVPHALDAMHAQCRMCHVANSPFKGASAPPASHAAYDISTCQMCHGTAQPAGATGDSGRGTP